MDAYAGQKVSSIELAGRPDLNEEEFSPLFAQHAGEPFDPAKVERTLAAIRATGKFKEVQLSVFPDIEGVRVLLILQPALYFGIYEFPGSRKNFLIPDCCRLRTILRRALTTTATWRMASEALTKFFQQNGYFLAKVTPQLETGCGTRDCRMSALLSSLGVKARFGTVTLNGASPEQDARLQVEAEEHDGTPARVRHTTRKAILVQEHSKRHQLHAERAGECRTAWARR